jgi:hypothetical protein
MSEWLTPPYVIPAALALIAVLTWFVRVYG